MRGERSRDINCHAAAYSSGSWVGHFDKRLRLTKLPKVLDPLCTENWLGLGGCFFALGAATRGILTKFRGPFRRAQFGISSELTAGPAVSG